MNPYQAQGKVTQWVSNQLKKIGFSNIKEIKTSNDELTIITKENESLYARFTKR